MPNPVVVYIGLGANLGDARGSVVSAMEAIAALEGVTDLRASSLYGSAPIDAGGADYVNAVVEVHSALAPLELLDALQRLEAIAGRQRSYRNAPRPLDLDILLYGDAPLHSTRLTVPHPRLWERAFVLRPLAELAPAIVSREQLQAVADQSVWLLPP